MLSNVGIKMPKSDASEVFQAYDTDGTLDASFNKTSRLMCSPRCRNSTTPSQLFQYGPPNLVS